MKKDLLLPRWCRIAGVILLIVSLVLFVAWANYSFQFNFLNTPKPKQPGSFDFNNYNLTDEFTITGIILSLFMIAFSRQKREDEYVRYIRLRSLQISVYVNYAVLLIIIFTVYGLGFLEMLLYNFLTILIIFIVVFYFNLHIKPLFSKTSKA